MAEKVWVVEVRTWAMQLMWPVDAREAVRLGDYRYAPVGGFEPPRAPQRPVERPRKAVA